MAKANLLTNTHTHSTSHLNLLHEHAGYTLNFFLFRYLLSSTLFKQNFRYLVLVKNTNFFYTITNQPNYLSFRKVLTRKKHVFIGQNTRHTRNKPQNAFAYNTRENPVLNTTILKRVVHFKKGGYTIPKTDILHKQRHSTKIYNSHPFFNKFGSDLRSNKWYFVGIPPIRFTQWTQQKTYFKYFNYKRQLLRPRIRTRRKSLKKIFFKKISKMNSKTLYNVFTSSKNINYDTDDTQVNSLTSYRLKYKIRLKSVPNTKLARKAPYKHGINFIWNKPYLFNGGKRKGWKFKAKAYSKYFLMGNVRKFFNKMSRYQNKTVRMLNSFKGIFKPSKRTKLKTKKLKTKKLKAQSPRSDKKIFISLKRFLISKSRTCKTLFLLTRFQLQQKIKEYIRGRGRFGFKKRLKRKARDAKFHSVPGYNSYDGVNTKVVKLMVSLHFKINFINLDNKTFLNTAPKHALDLNKNKGLFYNKFLKTNQPIFKRLKNAKNAKNPIIPNSKTKIKSYQKLPQSTVSKKKIKNAAWYFFSKIRVKKRFLREQPVKSVVSNFVDMGKFRSVYGERKPVYQQPVLRGIQKFVLLNFYYGIRHLWKYRLKKLARLFIRCITSNKYRSQARAIFNKTKKLKKTKKFLKRRRLKIFKVRKKFQNLVSGTSLRSYKLANKISTNVSIISKTRISSNSQNLKKKWQKVLNPKYKKKLKLIRFRFKFKKLTYRRFRWLTRSKRLTRLKRLKRLKLFKNRKNRIKVRRGGRYNIPKSKLLKRLTFTMKKNKRLFGYARSKFLSKLLLIATRLPFTAFLIRRRLPYNLHKKFNKIKRRRRKLRSRTSRKGRKKHLNRIIYNFSRNESNEFIKNTQKSRKYSISDRTKLLITKPHLYFKNRIRGKKRISLLNKFFSWFSRSNWYTYRTLLPPANLNYILRKLVTPIKYLYNWNYFKNSRNLLSTLISLTVMLSKKLRPRRSTAYHLTYMYRNRPSFSTKTRCTFMLGVYGFYLIFIAKPLCEFDFTSLHTRKLNQDLFSFPDVRTVKKNLLRRFTRFKRRRTSIYNHKVMSRTSGFNLFSVRNSLKNNSVDYKQELIGNKYSTRTPINTFLREKTPRWRRLRRVKFKPGYSKIWRKARTSYKNIFGLKFKYQHKLTSYLSRIYPQTFRSTSQYVSTNMTLFTSLVRGHFVADTFWSRELIDSNSVYLNNFIVTNPKVSLVKGDLLQLLVHIKHYIVLKWQKNLIIIKKSRLQKFAKIKSRPKTSRQGADRNYNYPDWIMTLKFMKSDVPSYFEVDYFTLSIFVIYNPLLLQHKYRHEEDVCLPKVLRLYNWKYIN